MILAADQHARLDAPVIAVMVNWNGKAYLAASLASVLAELAPVDGRLLLIDNDSSDGSTEFVAATFPDVIVHQTGANLGGAGGFSTGMRIALECPRCTAVWLLDNDIVVEAGALAPLLACLAERPAAGACGSQICLYDRPAVVQEIGARYTPWLGGLAQCHSGGTRVAPDTAPWPVDYLAACSVLIRRECLAAVGTFADIFIFYDDVEWGLRAQSLGWALWAVPRSVIRHQFSATKPTVAWREYYRKRNRLAVLVAHPPRRGGHLAALLYVWFVSYLVLTTRWRGRAALHAAYRLALDDALAGRLGRRDLAAVNALDRAMDACPLSDSAREVLVDIGEGAGDALAAMQLVQRGRSDVNCVLPAHRGSQRALLDLPPMQVRDRGRHDAVLLGLRYRWRSALRAPLRYGQAHGAWRRWTLFDVALDLGRDVLARVVAAVLAPRRCWRLLDRWRDRPLPR